MKIQDLYARVTARIIEDLAKGVRPWARPWTSIHTNALPLRFCGKPYSGINVLILWAATIDQGFGSPVWLTFNQARELNAHVRKGEHGTPIVFASTGTHTDTAENGTETDWSYRFLRSYTVFNVQQTEGLPAHYYAPPTPAPAFEPLALAESFVRATGADIIHGRDRACYAPQTDRILMPDPSAFHSQAAYYSVLAHELTHWTGHKDRLDRDLPASFGAEAYAREELIAELGAAFLCAHLGISADPREDHAAYMSHWLKILTSDPRAIFHAAAQAQKATDYLQNLQPAQQAAAAA